MAQGRGNKAELDWWDSPERHEALENWEKAGRRGSFENSRYFANARHAFKARIHGATTSEGWDEDIKEGK